MNVAKSALIVGIATVFIYTLIRTNCKANLKPNHFRKRLTAPEFQSFIPELSTQKRLRRNITDDRKEYYYLEKYKTGFVESNSTVPQKLSVISYSLYGNDKRYTDGALENAVLAKKYYPTWQMWIYHDRSVPKRILDKLKEKGVNLIQVDNDIIFNSNKMNWKLAVASDPKVRRFIIRDIDSRLGMRERVAVEEWIRSKKKFHVMRDHPSHSNYAISGGMWGATQDAIPDSVMTKLNENKNNAYLADMNWLSKEVWPIAQTSLIQHDSFSCDRYKGSLPFPIKRVGAEHIGGVVLNGKLRQEDVDILLKAKQPKYCDDRNDIELIDLVNNRIKKNEQKVTQKLTICTITALTSRGFNGINYEATALKKLFLPSLEKTSEAAYNYKVYFGYDDGDMYWESHSPKAIAHFHKHPNIDVYIVKVKGGSFTKAVNEIVMRAHTSASHKCDYYCRVNDDAEFATAGWASLAIKTLKNFSPKNVGAVGPSDGNDRILIFDFIHRTHINIFGYYYDPAFDNWWADDWITTIYKPHNVKHIKEWKLVHHYGFHGGERYKINHAHGNMLNERVASGKKKVEAYNST